MRACAASASALYALAVVPSASTAACGSPSPLVSGPSAAAAERYERARSLAAVACAVWLVAAVSARCPVVPRRVQLADHGRQRAQERGTLPQLEALGAGDRDGLTPARGKPAPKCRPLPRRRPTVAIPLVVGATKKMAGAPVLVSVR